MNGYEQKLTDEEIIQIIKDNRGENLTYRKLMKLCGYNSPATIYKRIKRLEKQGKLTKCTITVIDILEE